MISLSLLPRVDKAQLALVLGEVSEKRIALSRRPRASSYASSYASYDAADAADARQRARIEILDLWIADARRNA